MRTELDAASRDRTNAGGIPVCLRAAWMNVEQIAGGDPRGGRASRAQMLARLTRPEDAELLVTIARLEGDGALRAAAAAGVARRAALDPSCVPEIEELLRSETEPAVRAAVLDALPDACPLSLRGAVAALMAESDLSLRRRASMRLLGWSAPDFPGSLDAHVLGEPDAALRGELLDAWIARRGARSLLAVAIDAPATLLADVLARVVPGEVSWEDLAPLAALNLAFLDPLLLPHACELAEPGVRGFLVAVVARAIDPASRAYLGDPRLNRTLMEIALTRLEPVLDEAPGPDAIVGILLEAIDRMLARALPDRLEGAERAFIGFVPRIRWRVGATDAHGWFGAALTSRRDGRVRTVVEHTGEDSTSSITLATSSLELRAPARDLRAVAAALPDRALSAALDGLDVGAPQRQIDPHALELALERALPPRPALAADLMRIARIAAERGGSIHAEFVEGWWDPDRDDADRATSVDALETPPSD